MSHAVTTTQNCVIGRFESHLGLARALAHRHRYRLPNTACFDDLQQECLIALHRAAELFDPNVGFTFGSYAKVVVTRAAKAFIRREHQHAVRESNVINNLIRDDVSADPMPTIETQLTLKELWDRAFESLTPRQKEVVHLRVFEQKSNQDVGEQMGVNASRVSQLWSQAVTRMRGTAETTSSDWACT